MAYNELKVGLNSPEQDLDQYTKLFKTDTPTDAQSGPNSQNVNIDMGLNQDPSDDLLIPQPEVITPSSLKKQESTPSSTPPPNAPFWQLEYFKPYFDLSTEEAIKRLFSALWPFGPSTFLTKFDQLDLYVPLWSTMTEIFIISLVGNLVSQSSSVSSISEITFDPNHMAKAATWIPGYILSFSLIYYLWFKVKGSKLEFLQIVSLFSYSLVPLIPMVLLYIPPLGLLRVVVLLLGGVVGLYFLYRNLGDICDKYLESMSMIGKALTVIGELTLLLVIRFGIF